MKHYNEKPSKYKNLGEDVWGSKRHNFDTYENQEENKEKEKKKRITKQNKQLKQKAIEQINDDNFLQVISDYEFSRVVANIDGLDHLANYTEENMAEFRGYVLSLPHGDCRRSLTRKFNFLLRKLRKIKCTVTSCNYQDYFAKKSRGFTEFNGVEKPWRHDEKFDKSIVDDLAKMTKAVQFGNSLPESEREYCMHHLHKSIKHLSKYLDFDFKKLAFSFGARGKRLSIAHYNDAHKVLAFNRGWIGTFIHELGHAIDYSLGKVSNQISQEYVKNYRKQLRDKNIRFDKARYYTKNVEIFARIFEQFAIKHFECTSWMQTTYDQDVMPELTEEIENWIKDVLKSVLKRGQI